MRPLLLAFWMTQHAPMGADIALRVRRNAGFHAPPDGRPLLLIGNGTGIAGLRAHLKDRARLGRTRNWLVFGERNRAWDFHYGDKHRGLVRQRRDRASRPRVLARSGRAHLRPAPAARGRCRCMRLGRSRRRDLRLRQSRGHGSVDATLADLLGAETLERLEADGRYRRPLPTGRVLRGVNS